jgi:hypothetical protein
VRRAARAFSRSISTMAEMADGGVPEICEDRVPRAPRRTSAADRSSTGSPGCTAEATTPGASSGKPRSLSSEGVWRCPCRRGFSVGWGKAMRRAHRARRRLPPPPALHRAPLPHRPAPPRDLSGSGRRGRPMGRGRGGLGRGGLPGPPAPLSDSWPSPAMAAASAPPAMPGGWSRSPPICGRTLWCSRG